MKMFFLLALVSLPVWAVKVNVDCRGDEIIIGTDKHNNELKGAYICEKGLKTPIAIIKNENFDDKLDMEDSISFYVSATYKGNKKFLKKKFESFDERFKEFKNETGEKDAYFQVDFKDLYDQAEVEELLKNVGMKRTASKNQNADFFAIESSHRKRYYDPSTQRFLSPDPKGFGAGDPNFYRYVGNNPIKYNDPYGLLRNPSDIMDDALNHPNSSSGTNGYGNAFQHCLASCMMTAENGTAAAFLAGHGFEAVNNANGQSSADWGMDVSNNATGRKLGNSCPYQNTTSFDAAKSSQISQNCAASCGSTGLTFMGM